MTGSDRRWRLAAAIWAAAIFASGVVPTQSTVTPSPAATTRRSRRPRTSPPIVVLGFLLGVALSGWTRGCGEWLVALALAAVLGGAIEVIQGPLPYRDAQLADFLVDVAGAAVGLAAVQCCGAGDAITIASRMMLAATSSAGTS